MVASKLNIKKISKLFISFLILIFIISCSKDEVISVDDTDQCWVYLNGEFEQIDVTVRPIYLNGGNEGFVTLIYEKILYPAEARENGIQGRVHLDYEITTLGTVENVTFREDIGGGLAQEAQRVLRVATEGVSYSPAEINGVPQRVRKPLSILFRLE